MFQMHKTMNLSLDHVDPVFGVSNFREYCAYSIKNFQYTFYFGHKIMYEFTEHEKVPYGTRISYSERSIEILNKNDVLNTESEKSRQVYILSVKK
mmetsp:Transcript_7298/g.7378  ORF Transcript_7298/g.7378 Transcript_7298/m.7378 type:complete len:95 (-) Transcript_7298:1578-1862(-)